MDFSVENKELVRVCLGFTFELNGQPKDGWESYDFLLNPKEDRETAIELAKFALDDNGYCGQKVSNVRLRSIQELVQDLHFVKRR